MSMVNWLYKIFSPLNLEVTSRAAILVWLSSRVIHMKEEFCFVLWFRLFLVEIWNMQRLWRIFENENGKFFFREKEAQELMAWTILVVLLSIGWQRTLGFLENHFPFIHLCLLWGIFLFKLFFAFSLCWALLKVFLADGLSTWYLYQWKKDTISFSLYIPLFFF